MVRNERQLVAIEQLLRSVGVEWTVQEIVQRGLVRVEEAHEERR